MADLDAEHLENFRLWRAVVITMLLNELVSVRFFFPGCAGGWHPRTSFFLDFEILSLILKSEEFLEKKG